MKLCVLLAALLTLHCGDDAETILLLEVDTTVVVPAPDALHLTLTAPTGDALEHVSGIAVNGPTRIALIAGARTPDSGTIDVIAYLGRQAVARSTAIAYTLRDGETTTLDIPLN